MVSRGGTFRVCQTTDAAPQNYYITFLVKSFCSIRNHYFLRKNNYFHLKNQKVLTVNIFVWLPEVVRAMERPLVSPRPSLTPADPTCISNSVESEPWFRPQYYAGTFLFLFFTCVEQGAQRWPLLAAPRVALGEWYPVEELSGPSDNQMQRRRVITEP